MSGIRGSNTKPEMLLRQALHARGFRFRLHDRRLPGTPDIVLPKWRVAIQVHGCFWHRHPRCPKTTTPSTNYEFWQAKFEANVTRDKAVLGELASKGWRVLVVWECAIGRAIPNTTLDEIVEFVTARPEHAKQLGEIG